MRRGGVFQSTLPCGERPYDDDNSSILLPFQSTLPCGERQEERKLSPLALIFQSTLPCGERLKTLRLLLRFSRFQSTLPCGERLEGKVRTDKENKFQSTLPCGERHVKGNTYAGRISISIHAPVWGATSVGKARRRISDISIHAPVWGATRHLIDDKINHRISIHAPVWGATGSRRYRPRQIKDFNPRSRVGSDFSCTSIIKPKYHFNPRSRVGSDCKRAQTTRFLSVPVRHFLHKRKQNIRCSTFILPQSRAFSRHFSARKSGAFYGRFPFAHFSLSLISNKATRSASGFALLIQGKIHFFH